jgi:hypothetical protein
MRWAIKYNLGYKNIYFYILPLIKFHFKNIKIKYINKYQYFKINFIYYQQVGTLTAIV